MTFIVDQSSQDIATQVNAAASSPPDRAVLRRQLDEQLGRLALVDKQLADHNYQQAISGGMSEAEALAKYNQEIELSNKNIEAKRQQLAAMSSSTPGTAVNAAQAAATDQSNQRALNQVGEGQQTEQQRMLAEQDKFAEPTPASAEQQAAAPSIERQTVKERMVKYYSRRASPPTSQSSAIAAAAPAMPVAADVNAAKTNDIMAAMTGGAGGLAAVGSQVQRAASGVTGAAPIAALADGLYAAAGNVVQNVQPTLTAVMENITNPVRTLVGVPMQAIQNTLGSLGSVVPDVTSTLTGVQGQILQPLTSPVQNGVLSLSNVPWQASSGIKPDLPLYSVQSFGADTVNAYQISNAEVSFRDTSAYFTGNYNWRDQYMTSPPSSSTIISPQPGASSSARSALGSVADRAAQAMDRLFDEAIRS